MFEITNQLINHHKFPPGRHPTTAAPHVFVHCPAPILTASDVCQLADLAQGMVPRHHKYVGGEITGK